MARLFLDKSVLNVQITYSNDNIVEPILLMQGNAVGNAFTVSAPKNIIYEKTSTGDTVVARMPIAVSGQIHLSAGAPAIDALNQANLNYGLFGQVTAGVITVSSPGSSNYTYENVVISKPFVGYNYAKMIEEYIYDFDAEIPVITEPA